MITYVAGRVLAKELDRVELLTKGGVGYELAVPLSVYEALPKLGEDAALHAQPCDEATAPVTCPTMAPCAFAALPSLAQTAATTAATAAVPSGPAALRVLMPPSESAAKRRSSYSASKYVVSASVAPAPVSRTSTCPRCNAVGSSPEGTSRTATSTSG